MARQKVVELTPADTSSSPKNAEVIVSPPADGQPAVVQSSQIPIPRAVVPQSVPEDANLKHPSLYFNMELSWIDFNWRVLHLALDERTPLLERDQRLAVLRTDPGFEKLLSRARERTAEFRKFVEATS